MLKVALTHDIDRTSKTYQYLTHFIKALIKKDFKSAIYHLSTYNNRNSVYWNFDEIMSIENYYGVKSTFFFLIESIPLKIIDYKTWQLAIGRYDIYEPRIVDIIRYLDNNGWEIGLHGSYRSFKSLDLLNHEKRTLEEIVGHKIIGIP